MKYKDIKKIFLDFFNKKNHQIIDSASLLAKDDPSLMFTNAGMNRFKKYFLGSKNPKYVRITNIQKCLRITGKHNDISDVGRDKYHHTMFEMLGNWSFGDYFKKEAIEWAWELLTKTFKIRKSNIYVTIFSGNLNENLEFDKESYKYWKNLINENQIVFFDKKHNFWEMGNTGPCGYSSEIHIDLREKKEKKKIEGKKLINKGHPLVIELWNLVFIEFFRTQNGNLEKLSKSHVDTGMGIERLCMVLQNKKSTYDTDIFISLIKEIENITGKVYGKLEEEDIAIRVLADHIRAIVFAIKDGIIPSNKKSGYIIRKLLRRTIVYYFLDLNLKKSFLYKLVKVVLSEKNNENSKIKENFISNLIKKEELLFFKNLLKVSKKFYKIISSLKKEGKTIINGKIIFELYDTYGLPFELANLFALKNNFIIDKFSFEKEMLKQKLRSKTKKKNIYV
ncbi:alanine--tRNA ligase [Candidatus Karelsulcia muelleri]|uniref:alanine--tRNA ligase n=1 Tax=Candidatus Karelsulcia muelleri TaxID=336810 RepID=UPI000D7C08FC|nr:alanine--tRNA ligase [Candidatus Karelsulcia muelleri]